jgi:hypothetical protein
VPAGPDDHRVRRHGHVQAGCRPSYRSGLAIVEAGLAGRTVRRATPPEPKAATGDVDHAGMKVIAELAAEGRPRAEITETFELAKAAAPAGPRESWC